MFHEFYQNLPLLFDPIAFSIGSLSIRWYGLSYVAGFLAVYFVLMWRIRKGELNNMYQISKSQISISNKFSNPKSRTPNKDEQSIVMGQMSNVVSDFLLLAFFSALVGGRLGYVFFYDPGFFLSNPLAVISPFDFESGNYIGIFGMSYHGALLGIFIGSYFFLKNKRIHFLAWADFVIPAAALGYFFGRVGNFLNGELYGRTTDSFLGMYFEADRTNLRHPSQLYEAVLEGLLLFVILWVLRSSKWQKKFEKGFLLGVYLVGYGLLRILVEFFREPDAQIGFLFTYFTMGQLLSLVMIFAGLFLWIPKKEK